MVERAILVAALLVTVPVAAQGVEETEELGRPDSTEAPTADPAESSEAPAEEVEETEGADELAEVPPPPPPSADAQPLIPGGPCTVTARIPSRDGEIVACAEGDVREVVGGIVRRRVRTAGEPAALFVHEGRVWVELVQREARPLTQAHLTQPPEARVESEPEEEGTSYGDRLAPERQPGMELGLGLHPLVASDAALLVDAWIEYRARRSLSISLRADPLGASFEGSDSIGIGHGVLTLAYDGRWFQIGVGVGLGKVRIDDWDLVRRTNGAGLTVSMPLRLGARDGMHFYVDNTIVFIDGDAEYAGTRAGIQIPMTEGRWLVMRGGGSGAFGYGYGELGLRMRGRGSVFVTPAMGGGGVFSDLSGEGAAGFSTSVTIEYRP